jgi:hypothetical protein
MFLQIQRQNGGEKERRWVELKLEKVPFLYAIVRAPGRNAIGSGLRNRRRLPGRPQHRAQALDSLGEGRMG